MGMGDGPAAKKVLASEYLEQQTRLAAEAAEALKATAVKVRLHAGASFEDASAAVAAAAASGAIDWDLLSGKKAAAAEEGEVGDEVGCSQVDGDLLHAVHKARRAWTDARRAVQTSKRAWIHACRAACRAAGRPMPRSLQIFPKKTIKVKVWGAGWLRVSQASA